MNAYILKLLILYTNKVNTYRLIHYFNNLDYISTRCKYGQYIIWDNKRYESYCNKYLYSIYVLYHNNERLYQQFERLSRSTSYLSRDLLIVSTIYSNNFRIYLYKCKGIIYVEYHNSYIFYKNGNITYITIRDNSYCMIELSKNSFQIDVSYSANKCRKIKNKCENKISNIENNYY